MSIEFWKEHNLKNFIDRGGIISVDDIDHIEDWLKSEDSKKYHRQISKLSVPDALKLSNEWTFKLIKKATDQESSIDVEKVMSYEDGFFIVKLLTKQAYMREGLLMGHCVGGYDPNKQFIYSLRDPLNLPHATIEVSFNNKVQQIQGKENKNVIRKYYKYIQKFLFQKLDLNSLSLDKRVLLKIGLLRHENKVYDLYNLPKETLIFNEDLDLSNLGLDIFPNIASKGILNLSNNQIKKIPENYHQKGPIHLYNNKINEIPSNFKQNGPLFLGNNQFTEIPYNFRQNGLLFLVNNKITKIPDNFIQQGPLYLSYNQITKIPDNFIQNDELDLSSNQIKEIPKNFKQNGHLNLNNNQIVEIPVSFKQTNYLNLSNNKITKIPDNFSQAGHLDLSYNLIRKTPSNFKQNGYELILCGNIIKKLR